MFVSLFLVVVHYSRDVWLAVSIYIMASACLSAIEMHPVNCIYMFISITPSNLTPDCGESNIHPALGRYFHLSLLPRGSAS